ncbi:MAG: hypothetical protein ABSA01_14225 [Anaerolineales bacterium]|jgi:hypothetical protein
MKMELTLLNCLWLILPLLAWNLILGPSINDPHVTSDAHSPPWLLIAENVPRILVFALPVLTPLLHGSDWLSTLPKAGMAVYIIGTLVYFCSCLPLLLAPASTWSNSPAGLLDPRLTPYLSFLGIAQLGGSRLYGCISAVFIFFHTWHGMQNL